MYWVGDIKDAVWHGLSKDKGDSKMQEKSILLTGDMVNHPKHYNHGIETIDYIESHKMNFNEGNVIKYVTRYKHKNGLEDLKKAKFYLERLIDECEGETNGN